MAPESTFGILKQGAGQKHKMATRGGEAKQKTDAAGAGTNCIMAMKNAQNNLSAFQPEALLN